MPEFEQWTRDNREALTSAILTAWRTLAHMSAGHATDEESAEAALTAITEAWTADNVIPDKPASIHQPWETLVAAVNEFTDSEDMVIEGWTLVVERFSSRTVWNTRENPEVRVFAPSDVTGPHAVGMLACAQRRVHEAGVEG